MLTMRCRRWGMLLPLLFIAACDEDSPTGPALQPSFRTTETPSGIAASAVSASQIDVNWADRSSTESGFELHRSTSGPTGAFTLRTTTAANVTTQSDGGLTHSTEYCYKVRAFQRTGKKVTYSEFSGVACETTQTPPPPPVPAAPSGVNAKPEYYRRLVVTWVDNAWDEVGYRVERSVDNGATWALASWDLPRDSWSFSIGVTVEQVTCVRVIAFNANGSSPPSNVDCSVAPLGAADLTATSSPGPSVDLTWRDQSNVEDGYLVERSPAGGQTIIIATLPSNSTSYHDATVTADTRYGYRLTARRDGGYSDEVHASVLVAVNVPPAPADLRAAPNGSTSVHLSWTWRQGNEDGFRIERSTDAGATWATIGTTLYYYDEFTDPQTEQERQACYRVRGFNVAGVSAPSNESCTVPPAAPTNLTATAVQGALAIDLTWNDNSSAEEGYQVWRLYTDCGYDACFSYYVGVASLPPTATSYRDSSVDPFELRMYIVTAYRDGGHSTASNEASATASGPPQ
jgi:hypothetical protein